MKNCIDCKKEIYRYNSKRCKSCENKRRHLLGIFKIRLGKLNTNFKGGFPKCMDCGKELKDYNSKRCSECWYKYNQGKNHAKFTIGQKGREAFCIDCHKTLNVTAYYKGTERCYKCDGKYRIGEKSKNWNNGSSYEPYSPEFTEQLKESIRKRDNYTCQTCGMTEEEHLIVIGYSLVIHHIDYNKQNCKEDNLITVCQGCNGRANYNRDYWTEFYQNKIIVLTKNGGITK